MHHSKTGPLNEPRWRYAYALAVALGALSADLPGAEHSCQSHSLPTRVAVLELYTSEGCSSCPPADRWVSALPSRGFDSERVVPLAFHVDYWDQLGWPDRMAKARFGERQRMQAHRNRATVIYTPQLLLNGLDYRSAFSEASLGERLKGVNRQAAGADIALRQNEAAGGIALELEVRVATDTNRSGARAYLAVTENRIEDAIQAGENRGKLLHHDFVVRDFSGPIAFDGNGRVRWQSLLALAPEWKRADLSVVAFVEDAGTGDVLQALSVPLCRP